MRSEAAASAICSLATVREARAFLETFFRASPLIRSDGLSGADNPNVYLKLETELPTRSFKPRGALWALAVNLKRCGVHEVTACSTGNHGAAVAFAARHFGLTATIFTHSDLDPAKRARLMKFGARVVGTGGVDLTAASAAASDYASRSGVLLLDDATDPDIPVGPATIALEIVEQLSTVDTIIVPIGDTALIRGVGAAAKLLKPTVRILGVQAEQAPAYAQAWRTGVAIPTLWSCS